MKLKATRFHYVKLNREFRPKINRILEGKKMKRSPRKIG